MGYELIVTEKPKAAQRIASSLADGKVEQKRNKKVSYYVFKRSGKDIVVACAVGHLFQLAEKGVKKFTYPVFEIEWKPAFKINKDAKFTKQYYDTIKSLCKDASSFTVATDYDVEGEVIGLNVIQQICKQKDAQRMKFSTLTKDDLVESYTHKEKTLNWGQANAGVTRHHLDWIYGINLSRALTKSLKKAGLFKVLSSGRVQGPALKIIVEREKEIQAFKPEPYWQIELDGTVEKGPIQAWHEKGKIFKKNQAMVIIEKTQGKKALVKSVERSEFKQPPPTPFDLTTLQGAAFDLFRIKPTQLLNIAQSLYISGYISYPRTSSQQLPAVIGYKKILGALAKQEGYAKLCEELLSGKLEPNQGKKTDPAHPAIYPTGVKPSGLKDEEKKVYDLIVHRFMAVFGEAATRQSLAVSIDIESEIFIAKGITTVKPGWHRYYHPYLKLKENELPAVVQGEEVIVKEIKLHEKETQPPKRYTQASIIKEMEKRNLGTKSTRAGIIDTLYKRDYIVESPIQATKLGIAAIETLEKYSPLIVDEALTTRFENDMEEVRANKKSKDDVFEEAKGVLLKILNEFKEKEELIGKGLAFAKIEADDAANNMGNCPKCGSNLALRRGKYGQFIACKNYPECKTTFSVPNNVLVKGSDKICEHCQYPKVKLIQKRKKPQEVCINPECPSKKVEDVPVDKKCPKCGEKLVLRKSMYGQFLGCSSYPKCKYTEKLENGNNSDKK
ncbi:DNA topoisomerase I [Candidatus Woesearchaeota archaeon]|nr:DNA topoisomerase I [Candidatus Woesearchaeota archaeon]